VFEIVREDVSSVYTDSADASDTTSRAPGKRGQITEEVLTVPEIPPG
jgi:hypothetical protein